jgi:phage gp45-like
MSLAEQLKQRRESGLRQGETVVVDRFGKRFREVKTEVDGQVCRTLVPITAADQQTCPPQRQLPLCQVAYNNL